MSLTDCEGEKICRDHLVHPLVSQLRKMFTCKRAVKWSDMPQFTQLVSDPGPQAPTAEVAACSEGGKTIATGTLERQEVKQ